jgi:1,4-dihydroxy-2-naphthoyl-CoA synthase
MNQQQRAAAGAREHGESAVTYQHILYDVSEKIATITLNRPDRMNAWTPIMERDVRHEWRQRARTTMSASSCSPVRGARSAPVRTWTG